MTAAILSPIIIFLFVALAVVFQRYPKIKGFSYTMVIPACFAAAVSYPQYI